jgi:hypothetical protein
LRISPETVCTYLSWAGQVLRVTCWMLTLSEAIWKFVESLRISSYCPHWKFSGRIDRILLLHATGIGLQLTIGCPVKSDINSEHCDMRQGEQSKNWAEDICLLHVPMAWSTPSIHFLDMGRNSALDIAAKNLNDSIENVLFILNSLARQLMPRFRK